MLATLCGATPDNNYETTSCVDADNVSCGRKYIFGRSSRVTFIIQKPALTYRIEQDYFETHFSNSASDYTLDGGYYTRTISQSDLVLGWDDDNDYLTLSYTINPDSDGHAIGGDKFIR